MQKVKILTECGDEIVVDVDTKQKITGYEVVKPYRFLGSEDGLHWTVMIIERGYRIDYENSSSVFSILDSEGKEVALIWKDDIPARYRFFEGRK